MRKSSAVWGSLLFLVVAPGTVAGLLPWWISRYRFAPEPLALRIAGALLVTLGTLFLLDSFARFALKGLGTPAPVAPPSHLVVSGCYRFVRNPMYVAVLAIIVGQVILFGNPALFAYAALVVAAFHAFVLGYEEPALRKQFGQEYIDYCANVPRWVPRLRGM
jgi:protein-S-isoprenylcysteine O-methyltransferase Ste14